MAVLLKSLLRLKPAVRVAAEDRSIAYRVVVAGQEVVIDAVMVVQHALDVVEQEVRTVQVASGVEGKGGTHALYARALAAQVAHLAEAGVLKLVTAASVAL